MAEKKTGVRTEHPQYTAMGATWKRCRDTVEGEKAVHAATTTYLPRLEGEKDASYNARLYRTPFFNAVWRTVSGLKGMVFRKDPVPTVAKAIEPFLKDIDLAGTPLDVFAQNGFEELLTVGRGGLLNDYPQVTDGKSLTVAESEARGLRSSIQFYPAESIYNWKSTVVNGVKILTLVCLKEKQAVPGDEFSQKEKNVYRILDLTETGYRQRLFQINEKEEDEQIGDEIYPLMRGKPLSRIPFNFLGVDDVSPNVESPPLIDLVNTNLKHYVVAADYEHGCHLSGLPTLFVIGYKPDVGDEIYIGGATAQCLPEVGSEAKYVEVEGNFGALRENLDSKKSEMAVLGAKMLEAQKSSVESSETIKQRSVGEHSQLAAMASIYGMSLSRSLSLMSEWAGSGEEATYELNTDFLPQGLSAPDLLALLAALQAGAISQQTFYKNLQAGEIADSDVTYDEEQARIEAQTLV